MHQQDIDAGWPRQVVKVIAEPSWEQLGAAGKPWLWLSGAHGAELESEVQALADPFSLQWVWRGTPKEYDHPGYRCGPMLVPLNAPLLEKFISEWGPKQAGLILTGPQDPEPLLRHLQALSQLTGPDGQSVHFQWNALRTLEEMCEALPSEQLARLFGPIDSAVWHAGEDFDEWLRMPAPIGSPGGTGSEPHIVLSGSDGDALNQASRAWFMRHFTVSMTRRFPIFSKSDNPLRMRRQMVLFVEEAHGFGFHLERDIWFYMALRLRYPQEAFSQNHEIQALLQQPHVQGLQRLFDISDKLRQRSTVSF